MEHSVGQLPLSLGLRDEATFENFFPAKNGEIVTALQTLITQPDKGVVYLCGQRGQGCSHLLQASCHYAHQQGMRSAYLPMGQFVAMSPSVFEGFDAQEVVCIDELHLIAGRPEWEEAFFHLYNRLYDANAKIIIAANDLPKAIGITLPDVVSRLAWGVVYSLHSLSDEEKLQVLLMRAERRGIRLAEDVARYLLNHCPRHMSTLLAAFDVLDNASLVAKRRLTIPFVKEVLEI